MTLYSDLHLPPSPAPYFPADSFYCVNTTTSMSFSSFFYSMDSNKRRIKYSNKIVQRPANDFQYRKVGGFLCIQLLDLILHWRHNSKVRITIIYLCTAKHTQSDPTQLEKYRHQKYKKANFHFQVVSMAGHSDCAFGFTSCRINFYDCHLSFFT